MKANKSIGLMLAVVTMTMLACQSAPTKSSGATASAKLRTQSAPTASATPAGKVAQLVFIGKRKACDCTRTRIDESWVALEQVLANHPEIQVKTLEVDVDQQETTRYRGLKPLMTLPGVYLMDGSGNLIQMLQGELTAEQLQRAIGGLAARQSG